MSKNSLPLEGKKFYIKRDLLFTSLYSPPLTGGVRGG
jgi:hypothetical protein